jgi:hypothetical protein
MILTTYKYLHLALRLRVSGATPPLPNKSSWNAQEELYFTLPHITLQYCVAKFKVILCVEI